jgi:hypothetical protein
MKQNFKSLLEYFRTQKMDPLGKNTSLSYRPGFLDIAKAK